MPFPFLPKRRPPLPIGGQLPMGEMSEMPEVAPSRPTPIPLVRQEWRPPMAAPESEPMPDGFHPPMAPPSRAPSPLRASPFMSAQISDARPSLELQRPQRAPMPDIPIVGGGGATVPDNPYDRARRDYVMEGAKRNPDGSLAGEKLGFKRSGKDIALAALAGLGRGGLLGAATGALTATIDPRTGREMNFDAFHGPQIERAEDRARQEQMRQRQEALQQLALDRGAVGLDQERAQTELYKARAKEALNPQVRPIDPRQNLMVVPGVGVMDVESREVIQGTAPPAREGAAPFASSPMGIYDRRTGEITQRAPEKESAEARYDRAEERRQNTAADREEARHRNLKARAAEAANEAAARQKELKAINEEKNPDEWEKANEAAIRAQVAFEGALGAVNEHARQASEAMPDLLEGGDGVGGWGYLKRKSGVSRPSGGVASGGRKGTVGETHIQAVMRALGQSREQAIQSLRNDGYEVR